MPVRKSPGDHGVWPRMRSAGRYDGWSSGLLGPWSTEQLVTGLAEEYANLMLGLLTAVPSAIEEITTRLNNPAPGTMSEYRVPIEGAHPEEFGTLIQVGDKEETPFIVPARVLDASQGWAAWFVPTEKAVTLIKGGIQFSPH